MDTDLANAIRFIGVVLTVMAAVLTGAFLWVLAAPDFGALDLLFALLPLIVFGPIVVAVFATASSVVLRVGAAGVEFRALRYRAGSTWDQISGWSTVSMGPLSGLGLAVGDATEPIVPWWALLTGRMPPIERAIGLAPFAIPFRGSALEAELRLRAPRLFDEEPPGVLNRLHGWRRP